MSRKLTASDRKNLIRLASALPQGSPERRAILAGLKKASIGWLDSPRQMLAVTIAHELAKAGKGDMMDGPRVDFGFDFLDMALFSFDVPGPAVLFGLQDQKMVVMTGNGRDNSELNDLFGDAIKRLGGDPRETYQYLVQTPGGSAEDLADYGDSKVVSNEREAAAAAKKMSSEWGKMSKEVIAFWKKNGLPWTDRDAHSRIEWRDLLG